MNNKLKKKNSTIQLLFQLKMMNKENKYKIWNTVIKKLNKPKQNISKVNIGKIDKYSKQNETILIPGKVLSHGQLTKKLIISAFSFSKKAKIDIETIGGKCISLLDLYKLNPKGSKVKILG